MGLQPAEGAIAVIFANESDRPAIEAFQPTVYGFERTGFEQTPSNEWVAREAKTAVWSNTYGFSKAIAEWNVDVQFVPEVQALVERLRNARVDHQIQT